jgi:hypothetical protein
MLTRNVECTGRNTMSVSMLTRNVECTGRNTMRGSLC